MTSIEERLNADGDAWRRNPPSPPGLDDALNRIDVHPTRRPRRNWWIAAACIAIVLAAAAVPFVVRSARHHALTAGPTTAPVAALSCPDNYPASASALYVPRPPAGVGGTTRMVPPETPTHVTMCSFRAYTSATSGPAPGSMMPLSGSRELTGDLARVTDDLTWLPKTVAGRRQPCTTMAGPDTRYLIGLAYPAGTVWVSADDDVNSCSGSSNGEFTSPVFLGTVAANSFGAGSWQSFPAASPPPGANPCDYVNGGGRLGQETAMVPDHPISALVCRDNSSLKVLPKLVVKTVRTGFDRLVVALNGLPTSGSVGTCTPDRVEGPSYRVVFSYAQGPPVRVGLSHYSRSCRVDNGSLQSITEGTSLDLIEALLA